MAVVFSISVAATTFNSVSPSTGFASSCLKRTGVANTGNTPTKHFLVVRGYGSAVSSYRDKYHRRRSQESVGNKMLGIHETGFLMKLRSNSPEKTVETENNDMDEKISLPSATRQTVLQACVLTSAVLFALGLVIRQISHSVALEGLPIHDCTRDVSFDFEWWHSILIMVLVILVSSCRFLLMKLSLDFKESTEASNQQVLTPLEPMDYITVAALSGISEEFLFRGALLPLLGLDWKSASAIGSIFGILHLTGGRRTSFAIWASVVGFAYGMATISSSSVLVPMAAHSLNNLVGGLVWRYDSKKRIDL